MTPDSFLSTAALLALLAPWTDPVTVPSVPPQAVWSDGAPVDISGPPDRFTRTAVTALEDRHLRKHHGIDPAGALRGAAHRLATGAWGPGGSGLAQQTVKLAALRDGRAPVRRTPVAKLREAIHAVQLQALLGPERVLDLWFALAPAGRGRSLLHAPEDWHDTSWDGLDLASRAVLAATPRAPSRLSPAADSDSRRPVVTARAARTLATVARVAPGTVPPDLATETVAANAAERAENPAPAEARARGPAAVARLHARVHGCRVGTAGPDLPTGCSRAWMEIAAAALAEGLARAWGPDAWSAGIHGCVAVIAGPAADPSPLAVIGGPWTARVPVDRCRDARRETGSLAKLVVWHTAMAQGMPPNQVFADLPVVLAGRNRQPDWRPENAGGRRLPPMPAHEALARSVNRIGARMALLVGSRRLAEAAERVGYPWEPATRPAAALGTASGSPLETGLAVHRLLGVPSPATTGLLRSMAGVTSRGTAAEAFRDLAGIAGKTGTTPRDAWFVGHDGTVTVVVWVGRDDGQPLPRLADGRPHSGGRVAAPIAADVLAAARTSGLATGPNAEIRPYPRSR